MAGPIIDYSDEERAAADEYLRSLEARAPAPEVQPDVLSLYGVSPPLPEREPGRTAELSPEMKRRLLGGEAVPPAIADVAAATHELEPLGTAETYAAAARAERPRLAPGQGVPLAGATPAPAAPSAMAAAPAAPEYGIEQGYEAELRARMAAAAMPRPGGVQHIPQRELLTNYTVQPGIEIPQAAKDAYRAAQVTQYMQAGLAEEQKQKNLAESAVRFREQAEREKARLAEIQRTRAQQQADWQQQVNKYANLVKSAHEKRIDPDHIWEGRTGARVLGAIGIAMGEYGRALLRSERNVPLEMIRESIQNDIEAQKAAITIAQDEATSQGTLLGFMNSQMMSPEAAEAASRAYMTAMAEAEVKEQMTKAEGTEGAARLGQLQAQLEADRAAHEQAWAAAEKGTREEHWVRQQEQTLHYGGGGGEEAALKEGMKHGLTRDQASRLWIAGRSKFAGAAAAPGTPLELNAKKDEQSRRVVMPNGDVVYVPQSAQQQPSQRQAVDLTTLEKNLVEMERIHDQFGSSLSPEAQAAVNGMAAENKFALKNTEELGAITSADEALAGPISGENAASLWGGGPGAFKKAAEVARRYVQRRQKQLGMRVSKDPWSYQPYQAAPEAAGERKRE